MHQTDTFAIHHLTTSSSITHTIISLYHDLSSSLELSTLARTLNESLGELLRVLHLDHEAFITMANLACVNERFGWWWDEKGRGVQIARCNGIWDGEGREIVGFWVLEGVV